MGAACTTACTQKENQQSELSVYGDANIIQARYSGMHQLARILKIQAFIRMTLAKINYKRSKVDPDAFMLISPLNNPSLWFRFERV